MPHADVLDRFAGQIIDNPVVQGALVLAQSFTWRDSDSGDRRPPLTYIDSATEDHQMRLGALCIVAAFELGMSPSDTVSIVIAGLNHDIGKTASPQVFCSSGYISPRDPYSVHHRDGHSYRTSEIMRNYWRAQANNSEIELGIDTSFLHHTSHTDTAKDVPHADHLRYAYVPSRYITPERIEAAQKFVPLFGAMDGIDAVTHLHERSYALERIRREMGEDFVKKYLADPMAYAIETLQGQLLEPPQKSIAELGSLALTHKTFIDTAFRRASLRELATLVHAGHRVTPA